MLQNSQRPVIVCGTDIVSLSVITAAADLALQLQTGNKRAGLFYVLPGANAYGAAIASAGSEPFSELLGAIENGQVRALLLVETDPLYHFPDPERVKNALGKLELLVVLDYLPNRTIGVYWADTGHNAFVCPASAPMHIILPTLTHFETRASFINQEGRLQQADSVHRRHAPVAVDRREPSAARVSKRHPRCRRQSRLADTVGTGSRHFIISSCCSLFS